MDKGRCGNIQYKCKHEKEIIFLKKKNIVDYLLQIIADYLLNLVSKAISQKCQEFHMLHNEGPIHCVKLQ